MPKSIVHIIHPMSLWSLSRYVMLILFQALSRVHVNIVDLIDACRNRQMVDVFSNFRDLRAYTMVEPGRCFPIQAAKNDGFVKVLLKTF